MRFAEPMTNTDAFMMLAYFFKILQKKIISICDLKKTKSKERFIL